MGQVDRRDCFTSIFFRIFEKFNTFFSSPFLLFSPFASFLVFLFASVSSYLGIFSPFPLFPSLSLPITMVFLRLTVKIFPRDPLPGSTVTLSNKPAIFLLPIEKPEELNLGGLASQIQEKWSYLHPDLE